MIKDILVCLEGSSSSVCATEVAIALGRELGATLVGLTIVDEPDIVANEATGIGGSSYKHQRDEALLADAALHARQWLDAFADRCRNAGVAARTSELRGRPAATILDELGHHDLTVLGRDVNFRFETEEDDARTRDRILRRAGKPVIVVPEALVESRPNALIAYDDSAAAKRALRAFADSGMARDRSLHVAAMNDDGATAWETASRGCALFAELGLTATAHNLVSTRSVAETMLELRNKLDAGLIVLGAYTRSRFSRLLWGSVTEEMLAKTVVPLFLHY
jgi:nucleotide-binding universal stress UspA family protein